MSLNQVRSYFSVRSLLLKFRRKLFWILVLTLATLSGLSSLAYAIDYGPVFRVEYNTDRAGSDIRSGFYSSLGNCMRECANSSDCRAYTWVESNQQPPNYNNSNPLCWLKNSVPGKRRNAGMISAVKQ